jgi:hypothetical protein
MELIPDYLPLLTIVGSLGAAFGGARVALNGTKERVKTLAESFDKHVESDAAAQNQVIDRLARIETKLDSLKEDRK